MAKFTKITLTETERKYLYALMSADSNRTGKAILAKLLPPQPDIVTVTCYGETKAMERDEAQRLYRMCADHSDGCERERYLTILDGLNRGFMEVADRY